MTSMERVLAAMAGVPLDRPPYALTLSLYGAKLTACPLESYYTKPESYLQGQLAARELTQSDIVFAPFALTYEGAAYGCNLQFFTENPPNVKKPAIRSAEAFMDLEEPDPEREKHLRFMIESTSGLASAFGDSVPVCAIVTSPFDLPALVMGIDEWLATLVCKPDLVADILCRTIAHFTRYANALLSAGAAFLAVPNAIAHPRMVYESLITEAALPAIREAFANVRGPIVFHHGGNRMDGIQKDFFTLPNVAGFALDPRDSFSHFRSRVGEGTTLLGNLHGPTLNALKSETAYAKVRAIRDERKNDPRYLFITSGADIPWSTHADVLENIGAILREPCER